MNIINTTLLKQLEKRNFLTDGGMETDFIFNKGIDLPLFASFDLLSSHEGRETLLKYYQSYLDLAASHQTGFVLESPTWRANRDWAAKLGYSPIAVANVNRQAIDFLHQLKQDHESQYGLPVLVSGNIGPRGDGYNPSNRMSISEARDYHSEQINVFADTPADMVSAFTLNYVEEAVGITQAAKEAEIPVVISFTLETDGKLPTGQSLGDAITQVDNETGNHTLYYMINCAHPSHFEAELLAGGDWRQRIKGIRGNASKCSHAELDEAEILDDGNPEELGRDYRRLLNILPGIRLLGGCCGTDLRHVKSIAEQCFR